MAVLTAALVLDAGVPVCVLTDRDAALAHAGQLGQSGSVMRIRAYTGASVPTLVAVTRRSGIVLPAEVRQDVTATRQRFDYDPVAQRVRHRAQPLELDGSTAYLLVVEGPNATEVDTTFTTTVADIQAGFPGP